MTNIIDYPLSKNTENVFHVAEANAKGYLSKSYSSCHLLKALLHNDFGLKDILFNLDVDVYYIEEWADVRMESLPKASKLPDTLKADDTVEAVLNEADLIRLKLGLQEITPLSLLASICTPGVGFSYEQLKSLPLTREEVLNSSGIQNETTSNGNSSVVSQKGDTSILGKYCIDKTDLAKTGKLDAIFSRDFELKTILEILGRHSKPNVLITGESGVGKTALLNGFCNLIASGQVQNNLKEAQIYELDFIELVSGASYNGEIEDRFKKIVTAIKKFDKPILLIDELQNVFNKDAQNKGLKNILKSELAKGEITIIATITNEAYRKQIESDSTLSRRFEKLAIDEPSIEKSVTIIENIIGKYINYHNLKVDLDAIEEAVRLSKRFNKDKCLPDSAIDLLDRTMSARNYMLETTPFQIEQLKNELQHIQETNEAKDIKEQNVETLILSLKNKLSYLLFNDSDVALFDSKLTLEENCTTVTAFLDALLAQATQATDVISKNDISSTISVKTGIPVGKLQSDEKERLLNIENELKKRVIGQDYAVKTISASILESRAGLSKPGLPIGSFFFTGPTGTGKTELAKSLAEFLFQDENAIIRFDMSEFKEEHSAALLYGAPPGYVGYEEGGVLVNKIRQSPYSIVLFDEIEKAHPSVFDIFLQILDEGKLNDRLGKTGDFSNAVILFTSNIGSDHVVQSFNKGEIPKSGDLLELMGNYFRPEFLGRLTEIVPFAPITEANIVKIFNIQMKGLYKALDKQEIELSLTDKAKDVLAKKGFTPKYGARPLRGVIRNELRRPLSRMIITGKVTKGSKVRIDTNEEQEITWNIK